MTRKSKTIASRGRRRSPAAPPLVGLHRVGPMFVNLDHVRMIEPAGREMIIDWFDGETKKVPRYWLDEMLELVVRKET